MMTSTSLSTWGRSNSLVVVDRSRFLHHFIDHSMQTKPLTVDEVLVVAAVEVAHGLASIPHVRQGLLEHLHPAKVRCQPRIALSRSRESYSGVFFSLKCAPGCSRGRCTGAAASGCGPWRGHSRRTPTRPSSCTSYMECKDSRMSYI